MESSVLRDKLGLWESKLAPLSDSQREAFTTLSAAVSVIPTVSEVQREYNYIANCIFSYWPD